MCNMQALVVNGILHMAEDGEVAEETLTHHFLFSYHYVHSHLMPAHRLQQHSAL